MSLSAQRSLDTSDLTTGLAIVSSTATGPADSPQPAPPSVSTDAAPQPHYVVVVNSNAGSSSKFSQDALKAASPDATFDILSVAPDGRITHEGKEIGLSGVRPTVKRLCAEEAKPVVIQVSEKSRSGMMIRIIDEARMGGAKDVSVASERG